MKKPSFLVLKEGAEEIGIPGLAQPHQTTIILSTPSYEERKHPFACLIADGMFEVLIRYPQSIKDVFTQY